MIDQIISQIKDMDEQIKEWDLESLKEHFSHCSFSGHICKFPTQRVLEKKVLLQFLWLTSFRPVVLNVLAL